MSPERHVFYVMIKIDHERLVKLLDYNPVTGEFVWKVSTTNRIRAGDAAGSGQPGDHIYIKIDGRCYPAHVLAWLYVHKVWPKDEIDHEDRCRFHNCISNLREATRKQNGANLPLQKRNRSGFKGVSPRGSKFTAQVNFHGRKIYLGTFSDPRAAAEAYDAAALSFDPNFAATNKRLGLL